MPTNSTRSSSIALFGYSFIALFLYGLLVISDVIVHKYIDHINNKNIANINEAKIIEAARETEEDSAFIADAKSNGYTSLYYPDLFGKVERWNNLIHEYSIAPLAPPPHTNIYYCNEGYGQVRYQSDQYGFRNLDSAWDIVTPDALIIGDSYVQGACVNNNDTISANLDNLGYTSINLGTGGNSPVHYAAIAKTFTKVKPPRYLVLVFYPNDYVEYEDQDIYNEIFFHTDVEYFDPVIKNASGNPALSSNLLALYQASNAMLASPLVESPPAPVRKFKATTNSHPAKAISEAPLANNHFKLDHLKSLGLSMWQRSQLKLPYGSQLAIDTAISECKKYHCQPIVVYIPNSQFWRPDARASTFNELLKKYSKKSGVDFVDTTDAITAMGRKAYAAKGPHLSPDGYRLVAARIGAEMAP